MYHTLSFFPSHSPIFASTLKDGTLKLLWVLLVMEAVKYPWMQEINAYFVIVFALCMGKFHVWENWLLMKR